MKKRMILSGSMLTVILENGDIVSNPNSSIEQYKLVEKMNNKEEILALLVPEIYQEQQELRKEQEKIDKINEEVVSTVSAIDYLAKTNPEDFYKKENSLYMVGIERSLPKLLIEKFASPLQLEEYNALKKFWLKCCLNPNATAAHDLFAFLTKHDFKVDRHGNFYAYRNVVSKNLTNKELVEFVSNQYIKVKGQKKSPKNYVVIQGEPDIEEGFWSKDYHLLKEENGTGAYWDEQIIGNLAELYNDLPSLQEVGYTSQHTGKEDYKVGTIIEMSRDRTDEDNSRSCSKGFHLANPEYDYSSFGDTSILAICNPMDVVAVPNSECSKLRTCRWFFASVLTKEDGRILNNDLFSVEDLGDQFEDEMLLDLENKVNQGFVEEVQRNSFTLQTISTKEIKSIVTSLEEMNSKINSRVKEVL